jgi:hypothetical protein
MLTLPESAMGIRALILHLSYMLLFSCLCSFGVARQQSLDAQKFWGQFAFHLLLCDLCMKGGECGTAEESPWPWCYIGYFYHLCMESLVECSVFTIVWRLSVMFLPSIFKIIHHICPLSPVFILKWESGMLFETSALFSPNQEEILSAQIQACLLKLLI